VFSFPGLSRRGSLFLRAAQPAAPQGWDDDDEGPGSNRAFFYRARRHAVIMTGRWKPRSSWGI